MKPKLLFGSTILSIGLILSGCNSTNTSSSNENDQSKKEDIIDPNEQYKQEAKTIDYQEIVNDNIKKNTKLVVQGDVTYADKTNNDNSIPKKITFTLSKNSNGTEVYLIDNYSNTKFKLNSKVKIYGTYEGKEKETGIPQIKAELIEVIDDDVTVESKSEKAQKEAIFKKTGKYVDPNVGEIKVIGVGYNDEVGIDGTDAPLKPIKMGSMNLYISELHIVDIKPTESSKTFFNDQNNARAIIMYMKAENTSEQDITFHPNQSIIVTDTGEQVEPEMMMMGEVGGDFLGKVTKEGQTWWLLKNLDKDVKKVKLIISPPQNTDTYEKQDKERRLEFDILTWNEAIKRDEK